MAIDYQVLGKPVRDNALLVRIDSGQRIDRLLFDCGYGCLDELHPSEVAEIDHLFFSHLHMDHVAGFDAFFRTNFQRDTKPNIIWGPPETGSILQGRFQGYMWNFHRDSSIVWQVNDIHEHEIRRRIYPLESRFRNVTELSPLPSRPLLEEPSFVVRTLAMDHGIPSMMYHVSEKPKWNIDTTKLETLGLRPGPWLQVVKSPEPGRTTVEVDGTERELDPLRRELLIETPGESIAYLTDFRLDEAATERLLPILTGSATMVCECQYREEEMELAESNRHMTTRQVAELAKQADVGELVLFHLSQRYSSIEWPAVLREVREVFPRAKFPRHWPDCSKGPERSGKHSPDV